MKNLIRVPIRKDITGKRFGKLVVLEYVGHIDKKDSVWKCKCDCGNIKDIRVRCLRNGNNKTCGNCPNPTGNKHYAWRGCGELPKEIFTIIKIGAEARNIEFNVTIEYLWNLFIKQNKKCAMTGRSIEFNKTSDSKTTKTASLDRIDSSKGYIEGNLQWVHKLVNKIKKNIDNDDFIKICLQISQYYKRKKKHD